MNKLDLVDNDHILNVVEDFSCPMQDSEYNAQYKKWRSDENNKYGFHFVSDTREIAYMDGVGFIDNKPEKSERDFLKKNIFIIGLALIAFYLIEVFGQFIVAAAINLFGYSVQVDLMNGIQNASYIHGIIINGIVTVAKYAVPLIILSVNYKMPKGVIFPMKIVNHESAALSAPITLLACAMGYIATYAWGYVLGLFSIGLNPPTINSIENIPLMSITVALYVFVYPVLAELLFRGAVMQSLRQFGDGFALIFTSVIAAMSAHDISKFPYAFLIALCLGYCVICSGSLRVSITANIFLSLVHFLCALLPVYLPEGHYNLFVSWLICLMLFAGFILFLILSKRTENVMLYRFSKTFLKIDEKLSVGLLSSTMLVWLVLTFVFMTVSVKIAV